MKSIFKKCILLFFVSNNLSAFAAGAYASEIKFLQATSIGHSHNSVHLMLDVTNSPCSGTNALDRFTITSNAQQSVILAAVMAGKSITIYSTGNCNGLNIETISDVRISP